MASVCANFNTLAPFRVKFGCAKIVYPPQITGKTVALHHYGMLATSKITGESGEEQTAISLKNLDP